VAAMAVWQRVPVPGFISPEIPTLLINYGAIAAILPGWVCSVDAGLPEYSL
jgi:hypothetical protein